MKIKDIRQFRTLYKREIREIDSTNRNEHYVGVRRDIEGRSEYGFFEIYHGDKEGFNESDGIRGFLEGFLDMAKDGQAVYEFMQNAVDAKSTRFCLFWGKDEEDGNNYLMVLNNGDMFSMDAVRSILNVGVSTKSSNNFTIGKFGIGFKLAHRLVGRENGLDELIHQNYGPILFSWQDGEIAQLKNLVENPEVLPHPQEYEVYTDLGKRKATVKSTDPWLFKILITNFPCHPENDVHEEAIYDSQFVCTKNAFSKQELRKMAQWITRHYDFIENDFNQGSLFFIKLGHGKQSHLEEENLEEGVKFSLAILNKIAQHSLNHTGLNLVNLKGKEIAPVDLHFETFIISKTADQEEYRKLRFGKSTDLTEIELSKEQTDSDIEILLGYTDYREGKEVFYNAPNFYLFFPLSEEKHRLRFILHSNAFYKSASRTFLQKGSVGEEGINERLFRVFVKRLAERMLTWAASQQEEDRSKFLMAYANLLLSDPSDNPERVWVNDPLYVPLLKFIQANIPVKDIDTGSFKLSTSNQQVKIKKTSLPVDAEGWLEETISWFYWDEKADYLLCKEAMSPTKLLLTPFTIIDLLQVKGIFNRINEWARSDENIRILLDELNNKLIGYSDKTSKADIFKENISHLRTWKFENGEYLTLDEIANPEIHALRLLAFNQIDGLVPYLRKAGFIISVLSLSEFPDLFKYIQPRIITYLRDYSYLTKLFNNKFVTASFTVEEKHQILGLVERLGEDRTVKDRIDRVKQLALYCNRSGEVQPFTRLLSHTPITWLQPFSVKESEFTTELNKYLLNDDGDIYNNIINPFWNVIIQNVANTRDIKVSIFEYTQGVFNKIPKALTLSDSAIISVNGTFVTVASPYCYLTDLESNFDETGYDNLKAITSRLNASPLPDYEFLKYYSSPPFLIPAKKGSYDPGEDAVKLSVEEAGAFLQLCKLEMPDVYSTLLVYENEDGELFIEKKTAGRFLIYSGNAKINDYIKAYYSEIFRHFPAVLKDFSNSIPLQGGKLINRLTHERDINNERQLSELIELAIESGIDSRVYLVNHIKKF
ncbi:ATP-binding protein [Chitinophaga sedimenti]|uniref:sacsin N-terminal ATP-binding-like domain-containing protein n=1 Tax=Chitinophaga sedimenti TaxID=2033606 RepID=UPI002004C275|nr:ATP-binding protein [Chitinophaga sedimenti]MCK7556372.1 ATP-binding protein [Chitinophaga sedimenti]